MTKKSENDKEKLIKAGKTVGSVEYTEIKRLLPDVAASPEKLELMPSPQLMLKRSLMIL